MGRQLGEAIKAEMFVADVSQTKLAKELGVDQPYVSKIVTGRKEPSPERLWSIAVALHAQEVYDEWLRLFEMDQQDRRAQRRDALAGRRARAAGDRANPRLTSRGPLPSGVDRPQPEAVTAAEASPAMRELAAAVQELREAYRDTQVQLASIQARLWRLEQGGDATRSAPNEDAAPRPAVETRVRRPPDEDRGATHGFDPVYDADVPPGPRD